jgi:hypothetical protein
MSRDSAQSPVSTSVAEVWPTSAVAPTAVHALLALQDTALKMFCPA